MAESKTVTLVPLNGSNYGTWKVQCRMALVKDGLWSIVSGSETAPASTEAEKYAKFVSRRDKALAINIVLSNVSFGETSSNIGKILLENFAYLSISL